MALAALYQVPLTQIRIVAAGGSLLSLLLTVTLTARADNGPTIDEIEASVAAVGAASIASSLSLPVSNTTAVERVNLTQLVTGCAPGHVGVYCAVCDTGWFGGGEGKVCLTCESAGDPAFTMAMYGVGLVLFIIVLTGLMLKFGRKLLQGAADTLGNASNVKQLKAQAQAKAKAAMVQKALSMEKGLNEAASRKRKCKFSPVAWLVSIGTFVSNAQVKLKILVSLYQVLNGLGTTFSIPYPANYESMLNEISAIELDMPSLLPISCLLGGINYAMKLAIQTLGALVVILALDFTATVLRRRAAKKPPPAEGEPTPIGLFLADVFGDLSFFLLFLLYPGSSSKVFKALQCNTFNSEGEDGQSFLRVDFSIDCNGALYKGFILPYAWVMILIFPIGVPFYYWLTLFKNQEQLNELQRLEIAVTTEKKRASLGRFLKGRELREYQPEIDEAEERAVELQAKYDAQRAALPSKLKKLTGGYEMRTYGFEIFECCRKMALIALPIFAPEDSPEQLVFGLIICFITFGMYMMYSPYINSDDDLLSQICQLQIFFSLASSIMLKANPKSPIMGVVLPILIACPILAGIAIQSGCLKRLRQLRQAEDNGVPIPFTQVRIGVGMRANMRNRLEKIVGVKRQKVPDDDDLDSTTAIAPRGSIIANDVAPPRIKAVFTLYDVNQNGTLEYRELRAALVGLGFSTTHPAAADFIKRYDDKPDGVMQLAEFNELVNDLEEGFVRFAQNRARPGLSSIRPASSTGLGSHRDPDVPASAFQADCPPSTRAAPSPDQSLLQAEALRLFLESTQHEDNGRPGQQSQLVADAAADRAAQLAMVAAQAEDNAAHFSAIEIQSRFRANLERRTSERMRDVAAAAATKTTATAKRNAGRSWLRRQVV